MLLYADLPARRAVQLVGDALLVVWIVAAAWLGHAVHDATLELAAPGRGLESASSRMADQLRDAGSAVDDLPVVGEGAGAPLDDAGSAADELAETGRSQVEAVETLSDWLGWSIALVPIGVALAVYLPRRVRFVRQVTAGRRLVDSAADLDLFALRAMAHQPLQRLAAISDDPAQGWRDRDPELIRRLAALELQAAGLRPERGAG